MADLSEDVLSMAREVDDQCFELIKRIENEGKEPVFLAINLIDRNNLKNLERGGTALTFSLVSEIEILKESDKQNIIKELEKLRAIGSNATAKEIIKSLVSSIIDHTELTLAQGEEDVDENLLATLATMVRSFEPKAMFTFIAIDLDLLNSDTGDLNFAVAIGPKPTFLEIL